MIKMKVMRTLQGTTKSFRTTKKLMKVPLAVTPQKMTMMTVKRLRQILMRKRVKMKTK